MKRLILLVLAMVLILCACSKKNDENAEIGEQTTSEELESYEALTECRKDIEKAGCLLGAAYLGDRTEPEESLIEFLNRSVYWDTLSMIREIPEERIIEESGDEVFLIVPLKGVKITVYRAEKSGLDGEYVKQSSFFENADGQPFILQGNMGDFRFVVEAEKDGKKVEFIPQTDNGVLAVDVKGVVNVEPDAD